MKTYINIMNPLNFNEELNSIIKSIEKFNKKYELILNFNVDIGFVAKPTTTIKNYCAEQINYLNEVTENVAEEITENLQNGNETAREEITENFENDTENYY